MQNPTLDEFTLAFSRLTAEAQHLARGAYQLELSDWAQRNRNAGNREMDSFALFNLDAAISLARKRTA